MTTFLEDEASIEASQPREGIELVYPSVTYRITTSKRDIVIDGKTYVAFPSSRGEATVSIVCETAELEVLLPISHPAAKRYLANGIPPRRIEVNIWRKLVRGGGAELIWRGDVTSMGFADKHTAKFRVPSRVGEAMAVRLPTVTAGTGCPHILYDPACGLARNSYRVFANVISHSGRTVVVDSMVPHPSEWARLGELHHVLSGERMTVLEQSATTLTLQQPIFEIRTGDSVEIFAGCDHGISMCHTKFSNRLNFGGFPELPSESPFAPTGFGVVVQA